MKTASEWEEIKSHPLPDADDPVIVWHIFQGAMVVKPKEAARNSFMTHWRSVNHGAWICSEDRKPTRDDADQQSCVISRDKWGTISTAGWKRFDNEATLMYWQSPPEPPPSFSQKSI